MIDKTLQGLKELAIFNIAQVKEDKYLTYDQKEKSINVYKEQLNYLNGEKRAKPKSD